MSRSIIYSVTYGNNVTSIVAGVFNSHGLEYSTSHFNGTERRMMIDKIRCFENNNTKRIKSRRLVWNISPSNTSKYKPLHGSCPIDFVFHKFRDRFDEKFEMANSFSGSW